MRRDNVGIAACVTRRGTARADTDKVSHCVRALHGAGGKSSHALCLAVIGSREAVTGNDQRCLVNDQVSIGHRNGIVTRIHTRNSQCRSIGTGVLATGLPTDDDGVA